MFKDAQDGLAHLYELLNLAIKVEHSTIPPYSVALYSIHDSTNLLSSQIIRSVLIEEMLHMTLAANVLNAVGGQAQVNNPDFIPSYPCTLPIGNLKVGLKAFSREQVTVFKEIERPVWIPRAKAKTLVKKETWESIGEFYTYIEDVLKHLVDEYGADKIFDGDPELQVRPEHYYGGGGEIVEVKDLDSALRAIDEIKRQGEGLEESIFDEKCTIRKLVEKTRRLTTSPTDDEHLEFAHFFRFNEILNSRYYSNEDCPSDPPSGLTLAVDWKAVYPMRDNPKAEDYKHDPAIYDKMVEFNKEYTAILGLIEISYRGQQQFLKDCVMRMYVLKDLAVDLMRIPSGDGKTTVGPPYQYYTG